MGSRKPVSTKADQSKVGRLDAAKPGGAAASSTRFSAKLALQRAFVAAPTD